MDPWKKKKVPGKPTRTIDSVQDERFAHHIKNPVYRPVPRKEKKVEIDKRFQGMFNDEKFKLRYKVDKRGRPVETTTDENLTRFYNLEEEEDSEGEEESKKKDRKTGLAKKDSKKVVPTDKQDEDEDEESSSDDSSDEAESGSDTDGDVKEEEIRRPTRKTKLDEATRKKLHSSEIDFARGDANFIDESSSDDDDSSTDEDENEVAMVHDWGELDKDATRTEDSTRRLALCNMDWDRVRAVDLMVLLGSFLPAGGVIKSVTIYPSEFGKERMAEEDVQGPRELRENADGTMKIKKEEDEDDDFDDDEELSKDSDEEDEEGEGNQYHREKLRQYQLNRLKYFYAVAEFDSTQTAEKVYAECDGMEYESSAAKVDLRFIPDDMAFDDDEPKEVCTTVPDAAKYRPRFFTTTALQQVKVDLTWDETDPMRKELTEKIFDPKGDVDDDDIRAYLATSSSESEDEDNEEAIKEEDLSEEEQENGVEKVGKSKKSKQDAISKYKALLQSIESTESKKKDKDMEMEMEITWGVGLKDKTEQLVKKKLEEEEKSKRTPWQEMLDKRKDKRRMRKQEKKKKGSGSESGSDSDKEGADTGQMFSDDDVDIDMTDEFFQSEMRDNDIFKNSASKSKKKEGKEKKKDKFAEKEDKQGGETNAELELLLMDEDDNKRHFSLKKIIQEENQSKSKKKRKKMKFKKQAEDKDQRKDDFEIDLQDQRFSALFRSHHFNVDPSDPNFKKTKAMEKIITEKQKRRETKHELEMEDQRKKPTKAEANGTSVRDEEDHANNIKLKAKSDEISKKAELSYLVKSIKRKTESLNSKKSKAVKKSKY